MKSATEGALCPPPGQQLRYGTPGCQLELLLLCLCCKPGVQPCPGLANSCSGGENAARGNKAFVKIGCRLKSIHFVSYKIQRVISPSGGKSDLELVSFWGNFLSKLG